MQSQLNPEQLNELLTIVFVTIARNTAAKRFVRSVRAHYPKTPILSADQNGPSEDMERFYRDHGVQMLWLPPDCGLSFARNRAVEQVRTPYILLADDDFIFTDVTDLYAPIEIMETDRRYGFLGGRLVDIRRTKDGTRKRFVRRWEKHLFIDHRLNTLISIPIDFMPLKSEKLARRNVFQCDMTLNWGVMRRAVFCKNIRWDENIKINGEHEDFFLNLKSNSSWKVGYLPELLCDHEQPNGVGYHALRSRLAGRKVLSEKWQLTNHLEVGVGLRKYEDYTAFELLPLKLDRFNVVPHEPETPVAPSPISRKLSGDSTDGFEDPIVAHEKQISALRKVNAELGLALEWHKTRERALRKSFSWRLTKPIRVIAERVFRLSKAE